MRADQALVSRGLAPSRSAAARLIGDGAVHAGLGSRRRLIGRAAAPVGDDEPMEVAESDETRYVSRAGAKLAGALRHTGLDPAGLTVLDLGTCTGGFSDCLLQAGAAQVVGVDVGHDQLHPRLRQERRLWLLEGVNARHLNRTMLAGSMPAEGFGLIVADLSFISLTRVLPAVLPLAAPPGRLLALVKPQFELEAAALDARGVVRDPLLYERVRARMDECIAALGWRIDDYFESPLPGGDGNREFFMDCSR